MLHKGLILLAGAVVVAACTGNADRDSDPLETTTSQTVSVETFADPDLTGVRLLIPEKTSIDGFDPGVLDEVMLYGVSNRWNFELGNHLTMVIEDGVLVQKEITQVGLSPAALEAEEIFHQMVRGAAVSIDGDKVVLTKGTEFVTFGRQSIDGFWSLQHELTNIDGFRAAPLTPILLAVDADSAGLNTTTCRTVQLAVGQSGQLKSRGETSDECGPDAAAAYAVLADFVDGAATEREANQLVVKSGAQVAVFERLPTDGGWTLDPELMAVPDYIHSVLGNVGLRLADLDAAVSMAWCSAYSATITIDLVLVLAPHSKACSDAVGQEEEVIWTALNNGKVRFEDEDLIISGPDSVVVFVRPIRGS